MNIELDAAKDFIAALQEVEVLITSASECVADESKYAVYNKAAILLLAGKFENFAESLAEEYVFTINSLQLCSTTIPEALRMQHTVSILERIEILKHKYKFEEAVKIFMSLGDLWVSDKSFNALQINCKFDYGKHGETELKKLFSNIGIEDVFREIKIYSQQPDDDISSRREIDFKGVFNSVTHIRNNILHQDATPSLTHVAIDEFKALFQAFAEELSTYLCNNVKSLITT